MCIVFDIVKNVNFAYGHPSSVPICKDNAMYWMLEYVLQMYVLILFYFLMMCICGDQNIDAQSNFFIHENPSSLSINQQW